MKRDDVEEHCLSQRNTLTSTSPHNRGPSGASAHSVCVLILAYQRRHFLLRAVESVLNQTLLSSEYEVIVVKGFADAAIDSVLAEKGVKCLFNDSPDYGPRLVMGLAVARAPIVALLDDDDEFAVDKLARVVKVFQADPLLNYYHNGRTLVDEDGRPIRKRWLKRPDAEELEKSPRVIRTPPTRATIQQLIKGGDAGHFPSCIAVRRRILEDQVSRLVSLPPSANDVFILACALLSDGNILLDPTRLTRYRVHSSNTSGTPNPLSSSFVPEARRVVKAELRGWSAVADLMLTGKDPGLADPFTLIATFHHVEKAMFEGSGTRRFFLAEARKMYRLGRGLPVTAFLPMTFLTLLASVSCRLALSLDRTVDAIYSRAVGS